MPPQRPLWARRANGSAVLCRVPFGDPTVAPVRARSAPGRPGRPGRRPLDRALTYRRPAHVPGPPQRGRVRQRDRRGPARGRPGHPRGSPLRRVSPRSSPPRHVADAQGLPRLQAGLHELLHLPGQLVRPRGAAAEVRPRRDRDAGRVGDAHASIARSRRASTFARPSSEAKRGIAVVRPNVRHEARTHSVDTRRTPFAAMICAVASSSSKPCSRASTPASAPARAPAAYPLWAVTRAPRAWTAVTTRRSSSGVHGLTSASGPSR